LIFIFQLKGLKMKNFEQDLKNLDLPYTMDIGNGSNTLLITFAGISGALGLYPFEFFKITNGFDIDKIFIRDLEQSWYHQGLKGITTSIEETADYLKELIEKHNYTKVVCLGNSMGGYAALVIGNLIKADTILAFAPQTFLDTLNRETYKDNRWAEEIAHLPYKIKKKYLDLEILFHKNRSKSAIHIYYSLDERIDAIHAKKFEHIENVKLHAYKDGGHQLVQLLRKKGDLYKILRTHLTKFSKDRIVSVFQDLESGTSLEESLLLNGVKDKKYLEYKSKYNNSYEVQASILFNFFNSLKETFYFTNVDDKITNKQIYNLESIVAWYKNEKTKKQMFGTYFYYGSKKYLLHIEVGTRNLHIGLVKYISKDNLYTIVQMEEDDYDSILHKYNNNLEIKLQQRNWGSGWCSIDCAEFIDLSIRDKFLTLNDFFTSDLYNSNISKLIQNLKQDEQMEKLINKYIFTPGPVKMYDETLKIGAMQTPYFRNDAFSKVTLECEENLLKIANAPDGSRVLFLTASGTAGMEATVQNLLNSEDKALVVNGGGFGQRFVDICKIHNIRHVDFKVKDTNLSDASMFDTFKDATSLVINAHETSIGLLYDLKSVGKFAKENNMLFIVDAISMFITDEIDMSRDGIDALIISSHKGLALPPGLSMVILSPKAIKKVNPVHQLYFDFNAYLNDGERGQTPFTPAITIILQLQARLKQIINNGIEFELNKAKEIAAYFRESIETLPLKAYSFHMPNAMTTLTPTDGKSASTIVKDLDEKYNIIVAPNGGALQDKIFRVAHMGAMTKEYTDILIDALFNYYGRKR